ncbi:MAG: OmpL47-type beta-barrel domain-containing protein [Candidatus Sifarchaeia archaeon]
MRESYALLSLVICVLFAISGTGLVSDIQCNTNYAETETSVPTVTLFTESEDSDTTPPTTTIIADGQQGFENWFKSDVQITLSAIDDISGIAFTEYSFDNENWYTYTDSFIVTNEGYTTIFFRSVDNQENIEPINVEVIQIDKTTPETTVKIGIYAPELLECSRSTEEISAVQDIVISDVDGDGEQETICAIDPNSWDGVPGYILVYDTETLQLERTIPFGYGYPELVVAEDIDYDGQIEIIAAITWGRYKQVGKLYTFDGCTGAIEWESNTYSRFGTMSVTDVDSDGTLEIVTITAASDSERRIYVFDSNTYELEWVSSGFGFFSCDPRDVVDRGCIANIDDDPAMEIIFAGRNTTGFPYDSTIYIVDGETHSIEGSLYLGDWRVTAIGEGDSNNDGENELYVGIAHLEIWHPYYSQPQVRVFDSSLNELKCHSTGEGNLPVRLLVRNLDDDTASEIIIGTYKGYPSHGDLMVVDAISGEVEYQRGTMKLAIALYAINNNGQTEISAGFTGIWYQGTMKVYTTDVRPLGPIEYSDEFNTADTGFDPNLWQLESFGPGEVAWENNTVLGLTSWGHGHRTLVSRDYFRPGVISRGTFRVTDASANPCWGWIDVEPGGHGGYHGLYNYHFADGKNGIWLHFNYPSWDSLTLWTMKDDSFTWKTIDVDPAQEHEYNLIWTENAVTLLVDDEHATTITTNVPTVPLQYKMSVIAWWGNPQDQWLYVDNLEIEEWNPIIIDEEGTSFVTPETIFGLLAEDDTSNVENIFYRLNSGSWNTYSEPFTLGNTPGTYIIEYYAIDIAGNIEAVKNLSVTLSSFDSSSYVTNSEFVETSYFDVIFAKRKEGGFRLVATNPGQFYYNIEVENNWPVPIGTLVIQYEIPEDFVLHGAMPIHVYLDNVDITGCSHIQETTITVENIPAGSQLRVTLHMEYGLRGEVFDSLEEFSLMGYDFRTFLVCSMIQNSAFVGGLVDTAATSDSLIAHQKKTTAIAGFALDADGNPLIGAIVRIYDDVGNLISTTTTNEDGFYYLVDLNPGVYIVHLEYGLEIFVQEATCVKNELTEVNFTIQ